MRFPLLTVLLFSSYLSLCCTTLRHGADSLAPECLVMLNYTLALGYLGPIFHSFSRLRSTSLLSPWVIVYRSAQICTSILLAVWFDISLGYGYGMSFMVLALMQLLLTIRTLFTRTQLT